MKIKFVPILFVFLLTVSASFSGCSADDIESDEQIVNSNIIESIEEDTEGEFAEETDIESKPEIKYEIKKDSASGVCFIAHRGYSGNYQENTEESFIKAVEAGFGGIETDVRVTADGVYVVNHDSDLILADGTSLEIVNHTYEELCAQSLKNRKTDTELYLCTFERYLEICRDGGVIAVLELKGSFNDDQINEIFTMYEDIYTLKMCQLQSFNFDNLVSAHEQYPELTIVYTCEEHDENVDKCLENGFNIAMDYAGIKQETIDMFHENGLKVDIWTINSKNGMKYCSSLGVDYIESDYFTTVDVINQ